MLDFDASKLLIIGVVALVVIGPKDLPRVLRQVGQAVTKLRRMASDFQGQFMDAMKEADLDDLKKEVAKLQDSATLDVKFDPVADVRQHLSGVLEPAAAASPALDPHRRRVPRGRARTQRDRRPARFRDQEPLARSARVRLDGFERASDRNRSSRRSRERRLPHDGRVVGRRRRHYAARSRAPP